MSIYRLRELCLLRIPFSLSIHLLSLIWSLVEGAAAKAVQPRFLSPQLLCPALPCLALLSAEKEQRFYYEHRDQTNCSPKHTFWWGRPLWGADLQGPAGHSSKRQHGIPLPWAHSLQEGSGALCVGWEPKAESHSVPIKVTLCYLKLWFSKHQLLGRTRGCWQKYAFKRVIIRCDQFSSNCCEPQTSL